MKRLKRIFIVCILFCVMAAGMIVPAHAYYVELACHAAILIEETTGKVLYEKNADDRVYPASLTKLITALLVLENFRPDEHIVTGSEVNEAPWDASKAYHTLGETLEVTNLIRALMIPSGNESACVAAKAVAERVNGVVGMNYFDAETRFIKMMNEYAKELGATDTNFVNPHGYHHDDQYSTARDLAIIAQAAMANDLIRQIAGERNFIGSGGGSNSDPSWRTQNYNWPTRNLLIVPESDFYYEYATGIKTGFTDPAGYCMAASAEKSGRKLIAIVMKTEIESDRWIDARTLFEFGFDTFGDRRIQTQGDAAFEIEAANVRLGDDNKLKLTAAEDVVRYMSEEEAVRVVRTMTLLSERETDGQIRAPVEEGEELAIITLSLGGVIIYEGLLLAAADMRERTLSDDLLYHAHSLANTALSLSAVPYWIGATLLLLGAIHLVTVLRSRKPRRKNPYKFVKYRKR